MKVQVVMLCCLIITFITRIIFLKMLDMVWEAANHVTESEYLVKENKKVKAKFQLMMGGW